MAADPHSVEQAVSRALRDNLDRLQRMTEELHQAMADLVAACGSTRPSNALPPMIRAQTSAASLAAALEVLSRFITAALQPGERAPAEKEVLRLVGLEPPERESPPSPPPRTIPTPMGQSQLAEAAQAPEAVAEPSPAAGPEVVEVAQPSQEEARLFAEMAAQASLVEPAEEEEKEAEPGELLGAFDLASLSPEQKEMHRRANRIAKVSMQDIKMLRPEQVRLGRKHKDLCVRLRNEIEKAHKEYDRRFRPILGHPVDYFYHWMVEILADGNPEALGEYPYPSPVLRR